MYLNNFNSKIDIEREYPDFSEYYVKKGYEFFRKGRGALSIRYFKKALELIPDYTKALNGIAGVHFFIYENFEKALKFYKHTLKFAPLNPEALLGKAVSLQKIGKYIESNKTLDILLQKQSLLHGEAYYYKAYNFLFMKNIKKAREQIELLKSYLPYSGDVNYLSGLISLKEKKFKKCRKRFFKGAQR